MPIVVVCSCGKQLRAKDELAGKRVACPACGSAVLVAAGDAPRRGDRDPAPEQQRPPRSADRRDDDGPRSGQRGGSASSPPKSDDRREAEAPFFWMDSESLPNQVIALSDDTLFVAELDEERRKKARKAFAKGVPVEEVLDGASVVIPFDDMDKVQSNLHGVLVEVFWKPDGRGEVQEANMFCADGETRDELMKALEDRLGWESEEVEVGRLRASLAPLSVIGIFGFITFCFVMAAISPESGGGGTKVVRTNFLGAIFVWIFNIFGPIGVVLLGSPFVLGGVAWLIMVLRKPPILLTLTPAKRKKKRRD